MTTKPNKRWSRLCLLDDITPVLRLIDRLGPPEINEGFPVYRPGVFQLAVTEDGVWIHARLHNQWETWEELAWRKEQMFGSASEQEKNRGSTAV